MEPTAPGVKASPSTTRQDSVAEVSQALGARIRLERERAGMTVRGLARSVGVSPSLISQIERGRVTPSVATLWSIATELNLSAAELLSAADGNTGAGEPGLETPGVDTPVQRHETRKSITLATGVRWERLTPTSDNEVDFVLLDYPVGSASCGEDAVIRHEGREFGYVVSGRLGVKIGFSDYELRAGDSITFQSHVPHRLWTIGDEPAIAIWMVLNRREDPRGPSFD